MVGRDGTTQLVQNAVDAVLGDLLLVGAQHAQQLGKQIVDLLGDEVDPAQSGVGLL